MGKVFKVSLYMCLIMAFTLILPACGRQNEVSSNSAKQATIGDVNYTSLTEAVKSAKTGDTIKVYTDLKDNKNVVITKPITIKGILNNSQIRPKFYGCLTVDLSGENDSASIENLEIIHKGTLEDGINNDTRIGVNLINGGLSFKSNLVSLDNINSADSGATGMIISRSINSKNTKPITIRGNSFKAYKTDGENLSSALIIKSDLPLVFQKLALNEGEVYNQNSFASNEEGNMVMSINYSKEPSTYSFFATGSANELIKALESHQRADGSTFILYPHNALSLDASKPYTIKEKTFVYIEGNEPANLNGANIKLAGSMVINSGIENATIEKTESTANLMFGNNAKQNNITIKNKD